MNNTYLIYKFTSPSGKSYIGQTNNLKQRIQIHKRSSSKCIAFKNAIQKYGWDSFILEILQENLSVEEANKYEELFISEHNTLYPNGYNLYPGGQNKIMLLETKQKLSMINTGKQLSNETKMKMSNSRKGIPKSDEHKRQRSLYMKGRKLVIDPITGKRTFIRPT